MFDYLRITKTKAIICANDAKSCYDRIVLMAAFLCLRRMGLQSAPIRAIFHTIQRMHHYTSSAYGTSTTYYDTLLLINHHHVPQRHTSLDDPRRESSFHVSTRITSTTTTTLQKGLDCICRSFTLSLPSST